MQNVRKFIRELSVYIGPGYLIAVGYLDPGNWATDLAAGSTFGYTLLFVVLLSNLMAILLQSLAIRLGVVTNMDLAQACSRHFSKPLAALLYALSEVAIIATDLAEVIGSAIALKLLFGIPTLYGVIFTSLDVLVIIFSWGPTTRSFEFLIIIMVLIISMCIGIVILKSDIIIVEVMAGFLPSIGLLTDVNMVYAAVGIIGATVMPHNLYLHSSIVKSRVYHRKADPDEVQGLLLNNENIIDATGQQVSSEYEVAVSIETNEISQSILFESYSSTSLSRIIYFSVIDTTIALFFAFIVNCSILILSASNFEGTVVAELEDAFDLLTAKLGVGAGISFAIALLVAGQSSTITGTITGTIIMEGFFGDASISPVTNSFKPWMRRLATRLIAIVPGAVCVILYGDQGLNQLLIGSQIILSLQLPFCVWPLWYLTSSEHVMKQPDGEVRENEGAGHANGFALNVLTIVCATSLTLFNLILIVQALNPF